MFGDGSGGRLGFFSLVAWFLLLSAEECLRSSNGYLSGEERDMSQRPRERPNFIVLINIRRGENQQNARRNVIRQQQYHYHAGSYQQKPV